MRSVNWGLELLIVATVLVAMTIVVSWPACLHLDQLKIDGDKALNLWTMDTHLHLLTKGNLDLLNLPAFYPYLRVATLTDPLYAISPFYGLFLFLSGNAVAAYWLVTLASFVLCGVFIFATCRHGLGFSSLVSLLAGVLYMFSSLRVALLGHLQILWHPWLVVLPLLIIFYRRNPAWARAMAVGLCLLVQFYSSIYLGLFAFVLVLILWLFLLPLRSFTWQVWQKHHQKLAICTVVAMSLVFVLLSQYLQTKQEYRFEHSVNSHMRTSARLDVLAISSVKLTGGIGQLWSGSKTNNAFAQRTGLDSWTILFASIGLVFLGISLRNKKWQESNWSGTMKQGIKLILSISTVLMIFSLVSVFLFPASQAFWQLIHTFGLTFIIIPAFGFIYILILNPGRSEGALSISIMLGFAAVALVGLFISFGPVVRAGSIELGPGLEGFMNEFLPGINAIRVVYRWLLLVQISAVLFAAYGFNRLGQLVPGKYIKAMVSVVMILSVFLAHTLWPADLVQRGEENPVYDWIKEQEGDYAILELPIHDSNAGEANYMLSQLRHRRKLVNGYSGFLIPEISGLRALNGEPRPYVFERIRLLPIRYAVFHLDMYSDKEKRAYSSMVSSGIKGFSEVYNSGNTSVLELQNRGGTSKHLTLQYPKNIKTLRASLRAAGEPQQAKSFCTIMVNQQPVTTVELGDKNIDIVKDVGEFTSSKKVTEIRFMYHYQREQNDLSVERTSTEHDIFVVAGGAPDPDYCFVGINGGKYQAKKGLNFYNIQSSKQVAKWHNFNTSSDQKANSLLQDYCREQSLIDQGYLLLVSRFDATRQLTKQSKQALEKLGLKSNFFNTDYDRHVALIDRKNGKVLFKETGRRVSFNSGNYIRVSRLIVNHLQVETSSD